MRVDIPPPPEAMHCYWNQLSDCFKILCRGKVSEATYKHETSRPDSSTKLINLVGLTWWGLQEIHPQASVQTFSITTLPNFNFGQLFTWTGANNDQIWLSRGWRSDSEKCLNWLPTWRHFVFGKFFMWIGANNDKQIHNWTAPNSEYTPCYGWIQTPFCFQKPICAA